MARIGAITKQAVGPTFGRWLTGEMEALGWSHGALAYESNKDHERDSKSPRFTPEAIKLYMSGDRPPEPKQVVRLVPLLSRRGRRGPSIPYALANSYPSVLIQLISGLDMLRDVDHWLDTDKLADIALGGAEIIESLPSLKILEAVDYVLWPRVSNQIGDEELRPLRDWLQSLDSGLLATLLAHCYFADCRYAGSHPIRAIDYRYAGSPRTRALRLVLDRYDEFIEQRYKWGLYVSEAVPTQFTEESFIETFLNRTSHKPAPNLRVAEELLGRFELREELRREGADPFIRAWALEQWPAFVTAFPLTPWADGDRVVWPQPELLEF